MFYGEILDDEPIMLLPGGMVFTDRAETVRAMSGQPWSSYERLAPPGGDQPAGSSRGTRSQATIWRTIS